MFSNFKLSLKSLASSFDAFFMLQLGNSPFPALFPIKNNAVEKLFAVIDCGKYLPLRIVYDIIQEKKILKHKSTW